MDTYNDPDKGLTVHIVWALMVVQAIAIAAAAFLPFGFDKRSWMGLDFEHLILVAALYVLACLIGCILAAALREWTLLFVQLGGVATVLLVLYLLSTGFVGNEHRPPVSPTEVEHSPHPAESIERPINQEQVEKALQDAERELAQPPRP